MASCPSHRGPGSSFSLYQPHPCFIHTWKWQGFLSFPHTLEFLFCCGEGSRWGSPLHLQWQAFPPPTYPMRVLSYFFLYPEFSSWESCEDIWRRAHKLPLCPWLLCVSYSYVNTHLALGNLLKLLAEFISPILLLCSSIFFLSSDPGELKPTARLS